MIVFIWNGPVKYFVDFFYYSDSLTISILIWLLSILLLQQRIRTYVQQKRTDIDTDRQTDIQTKSNTDKQPYRHSDKQRCCHAVLGKQFNLANITD